MLITNNGYKFIPSENIKVFPCAYRGYYNSSSPAESIVFDPEARTSTESNYTDTFHKLSAQKNSYVIGDNPTVAVTVEAGSSVFMPQISTFVLKCVIDGYYFEIKNQQAVEDWFYTNADGEYLPYYLCIKRVSEDLSGNDEVDGNRPTYFLGSFAEADATYLDIKDAATSKYLFTGLALKAEIDTAGGEVGFAPLRLSTRYLVTSEVVSKDTEEGALSTILNKCSGKAYYKNSNGDYINITSIDDLAAVTSATSVYFQANIPEINPATLPITALLDSGSGDYSIRILAEDTDTTIASGSFSVALGKSTAASGVASVALGKESEARANSAFAMGTSTKANGENSFAIGYATETSVNGKNAVAMGSTTKANGENSFAFGYKTKTGDDTDTTGAIGKNAVAMGDETNARGENSFAFGYKTEASGKNSITIGEYTKTTAQNQVVIGKYNKEDSAKAFIIADGESTRNTSANKFTVSYTGDIKALGNLEVNGNTAIEVGGETISFPAISSTGSEKNDLVLGAQTTGSTGSISIYGGGSNGTETVFEVTTTGKTTINDTTAASSTDGVTDGALKVAGGVGIDGNLNVGGATALNNTLDVTGATALSNTLDVTGATTLSSTLAVGGATTLNDTLTVSAGKSTTLGGALTVEGNTTLKNAASIAGAVSITNATDYTPGPTPSAALKVTGGAHIAKKLNVGGAATLNNSLTVIDGKATSLGGTLEVKGKTTINNNTDYSVETPEGATEPVYSAALAVNGGVHITKKLNVLEATTLGGSLTIAGDATFNNGVRVTKNTDANSTAPNTGAMVVQGGVGIGQNLCVGGGGFVGGSLIVGQSNSTTNSNKIAVYGDNNTPIFSVDSNGDMSVAGALVVSGGTTVTDNVTFTGSGSFAGPVEIGSGTNKITISADTGISGLTGLTVNGQVSATMFNAATTTTSSDIRLKRNIKDYKFERSILDLPIKEFEYIKDDAHTRYIGCLAQDLQEIYPELVTETADGMLAIQESKLVYALIQEVKELKERVNYLERR